MARELTDGFPIAAQIPERFISRVFAKAFMQLMAHVTRPIGNRTLDVWFEVPTARLIPSKNPFENLLEVELPLIARLSDRRDESRGVFRARPSLIQVQVQVDGVDLIAPMVDFRPTASSAFSMEAEIDAYREPVLSVLRDALRAVSPFTAAPLFPHGGRQFFLRNYTAAAQTSREDLVGIFVSGEPDVPPLPAKVQARVAATDTSVAVLLPRDVVDAQVKTSLAAQGLGSLPAPLPNGAGVVLRSLSVELVDGFIHMSGRVATEAGPFTARASFEAWLSLFIHDDVVTVTVDRTETDGDALFDVVDLFTGGGLTDFFKALLGGAVKTLAGGAFGNVGLFVKDVPLDRAMAAVSTQGRIVITPLGLQIPVGLVDDSSPATIEPPYVRTHELTREFHERGCKFGEMIKHPQRYPKWQAAIAAGYNGCFTCQRQFNVVAAGFLVVEVSGPSAEVAIGRPTYVLTYTANVKRFGVPVGPLKEERGFVRSRHRDADVVFTDRVDFLVPGPWTLKVEWDGWTVTGAVDVRKHWTDHAGNEQGQRTTVTVTRGEAALAVAHG